MDAETLYTEVGVVRIRRRARRRSMTILLHSDRPIEVRANLSTSLKSIEKFLSEKKDWIEKTLRVQAGHRAAFPLPQFRAGEKFPFLGQPRQLILELTPGLKKPIAQIRGAQIILTAAPGLPEKKIHESLREMYKRAAQIYLAQRVEALALRIGRAPTSLKFGEGRGAWGSCDARGRIRLNWRLIVFRPEIIDYVVVHELAHLFIMNHSRAFWAVVEVIVPNFRQLKAELKDTVRASYFLNRSGVP